MKGLLGLFIGFLLGAMCRWLDIPVPSPPKLLGALLVVATTIGYMTADRFLTKRTNEQAEQAGHAERAPIVSTAVSTAR